MVLGEVGKIAMFLFGACAGPTVAGHPSQWSLKSRLCSKYRLWLSFGVAVTLISCARGPFGDGVITYWSANNQYEQNLAKVVVAEWNQLHPDLPVKHQPIPEGQSSEEVILAAVVGDSPPDVYSNMWPGDVELYVNAKTLVPLNDLADFDSVMDSRLKQDILAGARSLDGKIYQIPWKTNPIMMLYNKGVLAENGFANPAKTYSEYLAQAKVLVADLDGDGHTDRYMGIRDIRAIWWQRFFDYYTLYIAATGGKTLMKDGQPIFNNSESVAVFEFLQTLFKNKYFPLEKTTASGEFFLTGKVLTRFTGPWEITHAEKFKPEGFEYDFAPVPVPDGFEGPAYTYGDFKSIVIFRTNNKVETAWQFVKFMISRMNDYRLLTITSQIPIRKGILQDSLYQEYFRENPMMVRFGQQAEYVRGIDANKNMKEIFDAISQEYEACVVYSAKTPEAAIRDAANRVELILQ
jgi:multiple sugar transport system substrate-binding protein